MRRWQSEWLLLIAALVLLGVLLAFLHGAALERVNATERERLQALSELVGNDIRINLDAASLALDGVVQDYFAGPGAAGTSNAVDMSRAVSLRLHALEVAMPGVRSMLVLDAGGNVSAASRANLLGNSFAQRDYFKSARARPDRHTLYVSAPLKSLLKHDVVITVSRLVPGAHGAFGGLVVATLDPAYFTGILRAAGYAPDMWALVVHGDGRQLLNFPAAAETSVNQDTDFNQPGTLFGRHRQSGRIDSVLTGTVLANGAQRLMALHTIQPAALGMDKAIVIGLSRDLAAIARPMQKQALAYGLAYAILALACCAGLYLVQKRRAEIGALGAEREHERSVASERVALALHGGSLGLWSVHVPSDTRTFDENSLAMLGYTRQSMSADPAFWRSRIHPDDWQAMSAVRTAYIAGTVPAYDVIYRIRHRLGHWVWILARAQATERDAQGKPVTMMGTHMDISALKNAEQELLRSREELEAIFDNMTEAIYVLDRARNVIHINHAGRSILGLFDPATPQEEIMRNHEVFLPDGTLLARDQWPSSRGFRGDFLSDFEIEIRRKDTGAALFIECNTAPIRLESNAIEWLLVTYRDVSERRLGHALRQSEARFRTLIEDAPLAIAILRGGRFVYTNPRYRALHGYRDADELNGRPWSAMLSPESALLLQAQEALIEADSAVEQRFEAQGLGRDGALVPVFKTTTRVVLADGPATLVFAQDISVQKHAEAAMLQARDVAQAANRSKAEFLANMSHEIRSPLNAILGLAYLLEQARLNLDAHNMVRKIRVSGRMLLAIVNDILDVSKIEAGHMVIEQAPFRLGDVIDNLAGAMGVAAADKNIELIIHAAPVGVASVLGDALRLEQVLTNLTSNAIKFTQAGRVELRIELLARDEHSITLRFCVLDTGIGIAAELQGEVFSAFTQADSSTTRRFGGTGLGLTICRRLVGLMGGEIGLTSSPGQGSEFFFTLPLQQVASLDFSSPDMVHIDALIADDSAIALQAVGGIAESLGWHVHGVDSGAAVLAHLRQGKGAKLPDVVLLDWQMPGMDGLATARAMRQDLGPHACPIVIMASAYSLPGLVSQPGADMVDAFLNKPVTSSILYNAVMEAKRRRDGGAGMPRVPGRSHELDGIRVLIVDDSDINREVAQRILCDQGAGVTLAEDGQVALDWLLAHPGDVDVVLMDMQMPVMDGIEATRQLRRLPQFDDLPIVALTAGAFKSQQEAAFAAGMSHFISKPFDVPATIALLLRLGRRTGTGAASAGAGTASAAPLRLHAEPETPSASCVLDVAQGLQLWSDVPIYRDYLHRFAASYANAVEVMGASLAGDDYPAAAALAHKLAGVAANLALPATHRLACELERVLVAGHEPTLVLGHLGEALVQALAAIERFAPLAVVPDGPAPAMPTATRAQLETLFDALLVALDSDNPAPVEPILSTMAKQFPVHELADIRDCVRGFDFRAAEAGARELASQYGIILGA